MKTRTIGRIYREENGWEWFVDVYGVPHKVCFKTNKDEIRVCHGRDENKMIRFTPDNRLMPEYRVLFVDFV